MVGTARYRVTVRGRLSERFASAFEGTTLEGGEAQTSLVTDAFDPTQLQRLLRRLGDLGLEPVTVEEMTP